MQFGLKVPPAPRLPSAGNVYTRLDQEQLTNILRLYFNQLSGNVQSIAGANGGQYVECPNGLFFATADQTFALPNTAYPIVFDQTYLHNAVDLVSASRIVITVPGIYNFQYTGQIKSTNASSKSVWLWIRRDGTDIGYSTRAYTISLNNEYKEVGWNFDIDMQSGQYIEMVIAVSDVNVALEAETPTSPHPGIASSVMTINYISPLPDTLPTPP